MVFTNLCDPSPPLPWINEVLLYNDFNVLSNAFLNMTIHQSNIRKLEMSQVHNIPANLILLTFEVNVCILTVFLSLLVEICFGEDVLGSIFFTVGNSTSGTLNILVATVSF